MADFHAEIAALLADMPLIYVHSVVGGHGEPAIGILIHHCATLLMYLGLSSDRWRPDEILREVEGAIDEVDRHQHFTGCSVRP